MPTYGYQCAACNHTFEVFQKITDEPVKECPECHGEVRKLLYPVGIVFKGSGFHINDYCRPKSGDGDGNGSKKTETKTPSEPAPTAKADAK